MLESGGGAIVNMGSTAGNEAVGGLAGYVSAKHGVVGLTRCAAIEYADVGVRVNALAPGPILTETLLRAGPEMQQRAAQALPMRRIGQPGEVADAVVWLCSSQASFITGATIPIDGGKLAGMAPFAEMSPDSRLCTLSAPIGIHSAIRQRHSRAVRGGPESRRDAWLGRWTAVTPATSTSCELLPPASQARQAPLPLRSRLRRAGV